MKIVFIGSVEFSKKALDKLLLMEVDVVGVCTKQDSSFNSDFVDLTPICEQNGIPCRYVGDINSHESVKWIKRLDPDVIFCFGWSFLIKKELMQISPMGIVGYHPAGLPKNRGRHPLIWAIALGLKKSASTFFFMEEGADNGDILSQQEFEIMYQDDAKSIYEKMTGVALQQLETFVPQLKNNTFSRVKQEHSIANRWRKRGKKDGIIDFRMNSTAIYNLVRALTKPYAGAHLLYQEREIIVWRVEEVVWEQNNTEPGKVLEVDKNTILVKTYDGAVRLLNHEFVALPVAGEYL